MTSITLHYTEALVRKAVKAFWWRTIGWTYVVAVGLVLVSFIALVWSGDRSWLVGLFGAVLGFAILVAVFVYFIHFRNSMARFRRMHSPEATFELGDERFRLSSDVSTSEVAWRAIIEVWCFPDFWLLFVSKAQFISVPTADLPPEAADFILARVKACGAKVS